jgi:hypothetical protein
MNELIAGSGSTETVLANLRKVRAALSTREAQAQLRIDEIARQYGADVGSSSPSSGSSPSPRRNRSSPSVSNW